MYRTTFIRDERGNISILFGLFLTPLIAFIGVAVDYSQLIRAKMQLQAATDAAVLTAATHSTATDEARISEALAVFKGNLESTPLSGVKPTITVDGLNVTASATHAQQTPFMNIMGFHTINVGVQATASESKPLAACVLALNPSMGGALSLVGNTKLSADCWVWVNSTSDSSITTVGASSGTAAGFCTAGQAFGSNLTPAARSCRVLADPFVNLSAPSSAKSTCEYNNTSLQSGTYTLSPGVYCGGLTLRPHAQVTFNPGIYVIEGAPFEIQAQSSATGRGVLFYFTGVGTGLIVRGGGSADFTAPTTSNLSSTDSSLAGFLFIQDRTSNPGGSVTIQGGGTVTFQGVLYTPTWSVQVGGNGDLNAKSNFFVMIADYFQIRGNGVVNVASNASSAGLINPMPPVFTGAVLTH